MKRSARVIRVIGFLAIVSAFSGCGQLVPSRLDTTYGFASGDSLNGTGTLARLFRDRGREVRIARRYSERVEGWAETIVRFSPHPGPPDQKEADWLNRWLSASSDRCLIYVPHDFEAQQEYWTEVLLKLPPKVDPEARKRMENGASKASTWPSELPPATTEPAKKEDWFAVDAKVKLPSVCKTLEGPWAQGIDVAKAALPKRQTIEPGTETILLSGDGKPLVVEYTWSSGSRVLIVSNGSFLLNEPLARPARRSLATRVVDWPGDDASQVVFVEGMASTEKAPSSHSIFDLLEVDPLGWIGGHLIALGLIGGLAAAIRLGRARGDPPSGADRPVAHAEALGGLLSRTRDTRSAIAELEAYRRWRQTPASTIKPGTSRARPAQSTPENGPEGSR